MEKEPLIDLTLTLTEKEILLLRDAILEDEIIDFNTIELSKKLRLALAKINMAIRGDKLIPFSSDVPMSDDIEDGWLWPFADTQEFETD